MPEQQPMIDLAKVEFSHERGEWTGEFHIWWFPQVERFSVFITVPNHMKDMPLDPNSGRKRRSIEDVSQELRTKFHATMQQVVQMATDGLRKADAQRTGGDGDPRR